MIWALVPLKQLSRAKQRLGNVLSLRKRRALMQAMVRDVLDVLAKHPAIAQIVIVSADPAAENLARDYQALWWRESSLELSRDTVTLSGIVDAAAERFVARGVDTMLVAHGDLPQINSEEISNLIEQHHRLSVPALSIASDYRMRGTNCALLSPPNAVPAQYEGDSLRRYKAVARVHGVNCHSVCLPGISRDIDSPDDLDQMRSGARTLGYTHRFLEGIDRREDTDDCLRENRAKAVLRKADRGDRLDDANALLLADGSFEDDTTFSHLLSVAGRLRDQGHGNSITYSRKVFLPLTQLCRDVCHYCTFAKTPKKLDSLYMSPEQALASVRDGAKLGCKEALFTLGEKPELRYTKAQQALNALGFGTTLEYVAHVAERVLNETGVFPHINAGCMTQEEIAFLRPVSASMGLMLESSADRLCEPGMPHFGSPDKLPSLRMGTLESAGEARVPMTTGLLVGIGETRRERIESLLALRLLQEKYGHVQEIIIQNFRRKPDTKMANAAEPSVRELLWTIATARLIFGPNMALQVPPNLNSGSLQEIIRAGINDWGGVSPITPDYVNPESQWPHLHDLERITNAAGKQLHERLTVYPKYVIDSDNWLDAQLRTPVLRATDASGFPRVDNWHAGAHTQPPAKVTDLLDDKRQLPKCSRDLVKIVHRVIASELPTESDLVSLFDARGSDFAYICEEANRLRKNANGDTVTYVVNRNINYTNVCTYKCSFCAFSKGKVDKALRERPYDLSHEEIARRCREAVDRGATEVCLQGGIHPFYDGHTYINILKIIKRAAPSVHIHAFSPLEIWHGAETLGLSTGDFLAILKNNGLDTLPGTAAEILDDDIRAVLCPDKVNTEQWISVMRAAHRLGIRSTATIMFGHMETSKHWARHILKIRRLQEETGGFTEFVPLPFVHMASPIYVHGRSRRGPTFREAVLMHAVARLALYPVIKNIQASWVKMGSDGVVTCLQAGANDVGGTLMNESITKSAGAVHGQEFSPSVLRGLIGKVGRVAQQRSTTYEVIDAARAQRAVEPAPLVPITNDLFDSRQLKTKQRKSLADKRARRQMQSSAACNNSGGEEPGI